MSFGCILGLKSSWVNTTFIMLSDARKFISKKKRENTPMRIAADLVVLYDFFFRRSCVVVIGFCMVVLFFTTLSMTLLLFTFELVVFLIELFTIISLSFL